MGKIRFKWNDDLIWWLDLMGSGIQGCVSHSEPNAKLRWVVPEMSIKSSEGWNLMWWSMMLHNQSWCSISFFPHYSFHLALFNTCLSLTSPFSVTNIASSRTIKRVQKDVPTTAASNSLLEQVSDSISWGLESTTRPQSTRTRLLCNPYSR